jgi:hypothetical protein
MTHPQVNAGNAADDGDGYDAPLGYDQGDDAFDEGESYDEADAGYESDGYDDEGDAYDEALGDEFDADAGEAIDALDDDALDEDAMDRYAGDAYEDAALDDAGAGLPAQANAAWSAFEAELADALDVDGTDEFFGSVLSGFSRVAGGLARNLGPAVGMASRLGAHARTAGRYAGHASRLASAGSMLAQRLGHPGIAQHLQRFGQISRGAGRVAGGVGGALGSAGGIPGHLRNASQLAGRAAAHENPLSELLAQIGQLSADGADDFEAFDAMADLYEDGVDAALPAAVGLAARLAARALGHQNHARLSPNARRGFVRAIGAAARHLIQGAGPGGVRALPRIAASSAQAARRQRTPPQRIPNQVGRTATRAARSVARRPRAVSQLSRPMSPSTAPPPGAARPTGVGRGVPSVTRGSARRYVLHGPVELTIRPL